MAEALKANLPNTDVVTGAQAASSGNNKKVTKPQDLIRIYDIILQVWCVILSCIYSNC